MSSHSKTYQEHLREASYCGLQWRILFLKNPDLEHVTESLTKFRIVRAKCHSKACPSCARDNFNKIRRRLTDVSRFQQWRFFTLTQKISDDTSIARLQKLEKDFSELRKKLKRKYPSFQYIAVKELSPNGMWHYHGLWNVFIDIRQLSAYWEQISGSYRCHLEKVRTPRGAINYIFKYCFKSVHNPTERELLFEADKKKFTSSRGLLTKSSLENPYTAQTDLTYSVEELKTELHNICSNSDVTVDDFSSRDYPYFADLIYNILYDVRIRSPQEELAF